MLPGEVQYSRREPRVLAQSHRQQQIHDEERQPAGDESEQIMADDVYDDRSAQRPRQSSERRASKRPDQRPSMDPAPRDHEVVRGYDDQTRDDDVADRNPPGAVCVGSDDQRGNEYQSPQTLKKKAGKAPLSAGHERADSGPHDPRLPPTGRDVRLTS
jgi:hypothetical protein